ncbi:bifunctional glutamate N-acetyltransferase/amino-acid acetyltransferase ArgJ [Hippea maritima]|uniref:Arginine biosynthesis bifunctional protein ArgJ n=1 Tax=Hippea maritima (strain ATCC 700847 / DSM 10411 / MH2) TaxID=760142 RepID=F2LXK2_HIPMA|nr:bifunctional glutamate N-acetyltransferase/amino-acid acetyltransferase ArgJ [Hippea maritima]AEA33188.1 Arginine biosynthesis bifunctional protein ArgJ [Hippea maritima DSM 10411]
MKVKEVKGSICVVPSIEASAVYAGLTKKKLDVGLIYSKKPTVSAAVFTKNAIKAAPVIYDMALMKKLPDIRAVVVNSGNANACNSNGSEAVDAIVTKTAEKLGILKEQVFVASTGIIGEDLPYDKIVSALDNLTFTLSHNASGFAEAIMTTDTFKKEYALDCSFYGKQFHIGGVAKGAGMIHPNMATMLAFITTDINITHDMLDRALREAVNKSFNRISVDGDTSTNDTVFIMSTNEAPNEKIENENEIYRFFTDQLTQLCNNLAKMIVKDGEGATKITEVVVVGAFSKKDAELIARSIANSLLVKTAIFGEDPNWGRIVDAIGYSQAYFSINRMKVFIGDTLVFAYGRRADFDKTKVEAYMKNNEIKILVDLGIGVCTYNMWFSDLSYDYVKINAEYHT